MKLNDAAKLLPWLMALYAVMSFVHFAHNAEFINDYPNLPAWLSRAGVYGAWFGILAIGVVGYVLRQQGWQLLGLVIIAVYAALGFDGLLHYTRAPIAAHTATMNATIWLEFAAAALLFIATAIGVTQHCWRRAVGHRIWIRK